jgi:4-amino-4-deoxy-L-arabinose transferase-like glycosyltransferase
MGGGLTDSTGTHGMRADKWRALGWFVLGLAAFLFFARLGARALWSSEFRWAEIAREMLHSGDYFWPTINGHVYYDKPLGSYWLVVASSWVMGGLNETAARLPCAIAGLLAVAFLMLLARRLYDLPTGVISGLILATSFSFVFFSRTASADVETITGELAAILLFLRNERRPDGWWVLGLWVIMALTSLTKGLLGFVLPLMVIGLYATLSDGWAALRRHLHGRSIVQRARWLIERNRWLFTWRSAIAIAIGLAIYLAPFRMSTDVTGSEQGLRMVFRENIIRFFHPFDHRGPIYLYVYVTFALMAPWSMLLPAALVQVHHRRRTDADYARSDRFALVFFWSTFIFFTLSGSRRSYYILPILPAGALLVARLLHGRWEELCSWARGLLTAGYALFGAVVVLGAVVLVPPAWIFRGKLALLPDAPDRAVFAVMWVAALAAFVYALRNFSLRRATIAMAVAAYVTMVYIFIFAMPAADAYRGEKPFAYTVLKMVGHNTSELGLYKTVGPLFYLDPPKPLPEFKHSKDLAKAVKRGTVKWVIVRRRDLPSAGMQAKILAAEASFPWEGFHQTRNKVVLVKLEPESLPSRAADSAREPETHKVGSSGTEARGASASRRK